MRTAVQPSPSADAGPDRHWHPHHERRYRSTRHGGVLFIHGSGVRVPAGAPQQPDGVVVKGSYGEQAVPLTRTELERMAARVATVTRWA
jgi:hypothetical protein